MKEFLPVRLKSVHLENFKNVVNGSVTIEPSRQSYSASILGLYGQNGSGKTALIDALHLLKLALSGQAIPAQFAGAVNVNAEYTTLTFEMDVSDPDGGMYHAVYSFRLTGTQDDSESHEKADTETKIPIKINMATGAVVNDSDSTKALISHEILKFSYVSDKENAKLQPLIDSARNPTKNAVFFPETKFSVLTGGNKDAVTDLLVAKKLTASTSRSFVFSKELLSVIRKNCKEQSYITLLDSLAMFGNIGLFVISTSASGLITLNALPFIFRHEKRRSVGMLALPLNDGVSLPQEVTEMLREVISSMNIVLQQLVPGMTVSLREIGTQVQADNQTYVRVQLFSRKNSREIPLGYESEGIKKIISFLQLLIMAYNHPGITVAVDELDSGVFEYLLGELLQIFAENGEGQLIFTSHNLRPLETIGREFIAFTTVNPKNRYVRMNNLKANHNLRDTYYRNILLGSVPEELYEPTNNAEIAFAFQEAGDFQYAGGGGDDGE
ncbi:MAG: AAA family ATPase [Oscillospiraceae bacterium]|nr:AAA family ATPase [Oscillospiraceae bacterium]